MKKLSLYIPLDYVATRVDLVLMVLSCLLMLGLGLMMWNARVEVPPEPKKLVLRSAYVTHPLDWSKSSAFLYFAVGQDEGSYKYKVEFSGEDAKLLDVHKHKRLWVAVDADGESEFVWAVYDEELRLMVSRKQIEWWVRYNNGGNYFAVVLSCLALSYCGFFIFRCGVWNRHYCRRMVDDNRGG